MPSAASRADLYLCVVDFLVLSPVLSLHPVIHLARSAVAGV